LERDLVTIRRAGPVLYVTGGTEYEFDEYVRLDDTQPVFVGLDLTAANPAHAGALVAYGEVSSGNKVKVIFFDVVNGAEVPNATDLSDITVSIAAYPL